MRNVILGFAALSVALLAICLHNPLTGNQKAIVDKRSSPLYITPHFEGVDFNDIESLNTLGKELDSLEPGGAKGMVRMGYTLGFPVYQYFYQVGDSWEFDEKKLNNILINAATLKRPFVFYLGADHFFSDNPFGKYLASLPESVMQYQDGTVPNEKYFSTTIAPFRISNNASLPHIKAKIESYRIIGKALADFHKQHPDLLVGVSLNGETHYIFENFFAGTGNFTTPRYTDFSPAELAEFQKYLHTKGDDTDSASAIKTIDFSTYPAGFYPFFGWYCPKNPEDTIAIYHNGKKLAYAEMNINRLDVYESKPELKNPNCGFTYDIDFSAFGKGEHVIEAVLESDGKNYSLGNNILRLAIGSGKVTAQALASQYPDISTIQREGYVDRGSAKAIHVEYIPLARKWMAFRADQIIKHYQMLADILIKAGLPKELIYTYQLPSWMNGSWNDTLFGIGRNFFKEVGLNAGINLYGGNVLNPEIMKYLPEHTAYGIGEFHPQIEHDQTIAERSLLFHAEHGATFIAPYYLSTIPKKHNASNHHFMLIEPLNERYGSNYLYKAIKQLGAY